MKSSSPLSWIELSRKNLVHNIGQFRKLAKKGTKFSVAIKGNAYGHGQREVAEIMAPYADYFQVDSTEELEILRQVSKKPALVLGYIQESDISGILRLGCIISIFSIEQLKKLNKLAEKLKVKQRIHIPVDAHLGREGFLLSELPELFREIKKSKKIKFTGIYAHFANIEDTANFTHAKKQIDEYTNAVKLAAEFGFKDLQTHISATSGLLVYEKGKGAHPLVRLGIGVYGMWPGEHLKLKYRNRIKLRPVLSLKTKVAQIKTLPKGSTIGYGLTHKAVKTTKIALIPIGYADGMDRGFSNKGKVLIKGTKCEILGRISMNMFVVDINHLPNAKIEDEVVILGRQGKREITAEEMAEEIGTINYEITARLSPLLPRIVI